MTAAIIAVSGIGTVLFRVLAVTVQTAAGVLGMASGFLFGSSLTSSGLLPEALCAIPSPVTLDSGVLPCLLVAIARLLVGTSVTIMCKSLTDRIMKQVRVAVCARAVNRSCVSFTSAGSVTARVCCALHLRVPSSFSIRAADVAMSCCSCTRSPPSGRVCSRCTPWRGLCPA